ncbi:MAG: HAMP domain-containing histidine kinase [Myxococcales bacterium]|nr:HAMP domain-containing histidine kinase [Myxococcales bacterium]
MLDFLSKLFDSSDFPARWHCGRWTAFHGWLQIASDTAIFGAYIAIPLVLAYFVLRKQDVPFSRIFFLFAAFIVSCGSTHLLDAVMFWEPVYRVSALLKLLTAGVSWVTVAVLIPTLPKALALRSPESLAKEVDVRTAELRASESALSRANHDLAEKNDEMEQFVYSVSHDLRAPLVTSAGFLAALKEDIRAASQEGIAHDIARLEHANQRMTLMIDDLLNLSRIGRVRLEPEWIDPRVIIDEVLSELGPLVASVQARTAVQATFPQLCVDRENFTRIMVNLLTNALKHACPERGCTIEIGSEMHGPEIRVFVRDDGPGLEAQHHERIFGLFERANPKTPGTGIGLAIVAKAMQRRGGRVWIESVPGQGATFWLSFPPMPAQEA